MKPKHFITGTEFSTKVLVQIIHHAIEYKNGGELPDMHNKILTLIFANPSLRTRLSFESGMKKMNGEVNVLNAADAWNIEYAKGSVMNGGTQEHIKEAAKVISTYTDCLALRKCDLMQKKHEDIGISWQQLKKDEAILALSKYATVPVINMESNMYHPCQSLADIMTMYELFSGNLKKKKYVLTWAPHPKALPLATAHSQFLMPILFGMDITVAAPEGFILDDDVVKQGYELAKISGSNITFSYDQKAAFEGAHVVMAKSFASLHYLDNPTQEKNHRKKYNNWIVNSQKMEYTESAYFMHCLPVRRNVVVTDRVLDSPHSKVLLQAENRMWAQMSLLNYLLTA